MTKLQILYEKLMKIAYIFGAIFLVLLVIDLGIGMASGQIDCQAEDASLCIRESADFYRFTIVPLIAGTLIFIVAGRIFYEFAHHESGLQSVNEGPYPSASESHGNLSS